MCGSLARNGHPYRSTCDVCDDVFKHCISLAVHKYVYTCDLENVCILYNVHAFSDATTLTRYTNKAPRNQDTQAPADKRITTVQHC